MLLHKKLFVSQTGKKFKFIQYQNLLKIVNNNKLKS